MEIKNNGSLRAYMKSKYGDKAFKSNGDIKMEYLRRAKIYASPSVKKKINFAIVSRGWKHGK